MREQKSKTYLYFFRHGETEWNRLELGMGGKQDIPLNDTGRQQARELASKLKKLPIQLIVTSPLSRALETAQIASSDMHVSIVSFPLI